jgi:single stranded DNA-binding protein
LKNFREAKCLSTKLSWLEISGAIQNCATPRKEFLFAVSVWPLTKNGRIGALVSPDLTTWFRVTLWGRQAETASQYLTRGRPVYVEGRLRVEEWTDRDGKARHTLEVHATDMQFIGGGKGEGGREEKEAASSSPEPTDL